MGPEKLHELNPHATAALRTAQAEGSNRGSSQESEKATLGACLLGQDGVTTVLAELTDASYADKRNVEVFQAIAGLWEDRKPIDLMTVTDWLRGANTLKKAGGLEYLAALCQTVPVSANLPAHVAAVKEAHRWRQIGEFWRQSRDQLWEPDADPDAVIARLQAKVAKLSRDTTRAGCDDYELHGYEIVQRYLSGGAAEPGQEAIEPFGTGFDELDDAMGKMRGGDLIYLAGKWKTGKSFLGLNIGHRVALTGRHVFYAALEMLNDENLERLLSIESGVETEKIREGTMSTHEAKEVDRAALRIQGLRLAIYDNLFTPAEIEAEMMRRHAQKRLTLAIIDHAHLVSSRGKDEVERTKVTLDWLRKLANRMRIPIIVLGQFKNEPEGTDPTVRPTSARLFGGNAVKTLPTKILLLHRPDPTGARFEIILDVTRGKGQGSVLTYTFMPERASFGPWSSRDAERDTRYSPATYP